MRFSKLAIAGAVVAACSGVRADDQSPPPFDLSSGTAYFGAAHNEPVAFTDTFTFINGPVLADVTASLVTIALGPAHKNIDFTEAWLNGTIPFTLTGPGLFETGQVSASNIAGPFNITVKGTVAGVGGASYASYSGTLNVTPVPEPETYAMMLAGLGAIVFVAARRRRRG